ncbi:hypothetical protein POM88_034134 [Heracleum sosnowskyi]|uniref:Uncharacterized protein n=1 Tax=Heracleum sosnowskyi TaxID=360622 RepID=A0AAD8MCQ1_9APIA|nr:hypothetical protein POM88_034134 [Heracleum sosnowskyi]
MASSSSSVIEPKQGKSYKGLGISTAKMLQMRELYGNVTTSVKGKYSFREEYTKRLVSEPLIWRYDVRDTSIACTLEQVDIIANMPEGEFETDLIISGDKDGSLSFHVVVDKDSQEPLRSTPDRSIASLENALTQGNRIASSESHPAFGSNVFVMKVSDQFMLYHSSPRIVRQLYGIASLNGTNIGAAIVNVETGAQSWVCRCESDIMSVQLDNSEKIALCGLQNGAIVSVDLRLRPQARLTRKSIILQSHRTGKSKSSSEDSARRGFELRGSIYPSGTTSTTSSISCLSSLKQYDQYFLASSMDGSTKLYDHRMVQRGAVLSYQGNVGLHYAIRHAVDPSENYVMSGGQDGKVRLWSVKSGELLFEEMFMGSMPLQYCWGKKEDNCGEVGKIYNEHSNFGEAWMGAQDGLYLMRW